MQEKLNLNTEKKLGVISTKQPQYLCMEFPEGFSSNLVLMSAIEKLINNIDKIPADKLDEFVDIYAV